MIQRFDVNALFEVVIEIDTNGQSDVHPRFGQASQYAYVIAGDAANAIQLARARLLLMGLALVDSKPLITQLNPALWDQFVMEKWPAYRDHLPTRAEIMAMMHTPAVFLGSFYPHE